MTAEYLGKEQANELFSAGFMDAMFDAKLEKKAEAGLTWAKVLSALKGAGKAGASAGAGATEIVSKLISSIPGLAISGMGVGALGAIGYNTVKDQLTERSPKEELSAKLDAMYENRTKELESDKWMDRVRSMRDELKRGYKKMSVEEYSAKYKALVDALDERKA